MEIPRETQMKFVSHKLQDRVMSMVETCKRNSNATRKATSENMASNEETPHVQIPSLWL